MTQAQKDIFDHHHGRVHHQTYGYCQTAQRHQIGRNAEIVHYHKSDQRRDDKRRTHDQAHAQVTQQDDHYQNYEDQGLDQYTVYRLQRGINHNGTVIKRHELKPARQQLAFVDLDDLFLDPPDDLLGIAATQHHHDARDRFGI